MPSEQPHRRFNALTGEWVLVSPHRTQRPWQGQVEKKAAPTPPLTTPPAISAPATSAPAACGTRATRAPSSSTTTSPRCKPDTPRDRVRRDGLLVASGEPGICRVICFSPRPRPLARATWSVPDIARGGRRVGRAVSRSSGARRHQPRADLREPRRGDGREQSASAWPDLGAATRAERAARPSWRALRDDRARRGTLPAVRLPGLELERGERMVCANDAFVALVPFWAVWPFETLVLAARHVAAARAADEDAERDALADILKRLTTPLRQPVRDVVSLLDGIHQAPTDGAAHPEWHLHVHFYPPLLRSATVRKFMVGYEMLGSRSATSRRRRRRSGCAK